MGINFLEGGVIDAVEEVPHDIIRAIFLCPPYLSGEQPVQGLMIGQAEESSPVVPGKKRNSGIKESRRFYKEAKYTSTANGPQPSKAYPFDDTVTEHVSVALPWNYAV
jgi:hypothetical protein